jgi:hypothetical protein
MKLTALVHELERTLGREAVLCPTLYEERWMRGRRAVPVGNGEGRIYGY